MTVDIEVVPLEKPDDVNVIVGQSHFIKTVEDLHEALAGVGGALKFGVAFCEASGARLVRRTGNDGSLVDLAVAAALAIGAGHSFVIMLRDGFPVNVLNQVTAVPAVCSIYCATANPVQILVAVTDAGRGVAGVIDGEPPVGVENEQAFRCCGTPVFRALPITSRTERSSTSRWTTSKARTSATSWQPNRLNSRPNSIPWPRA